MKCNVKGHRMDRNVFGVVYPTFRTAEQRKGKYRETDEGRRELEERRKMKEQLHANFAERDSIQINRKFECGGKSE